MSADFHWMQLGNCYQFGVTGPEDDYWFEQYEASDEVAKNVDAMCVACPMLEVCYEYGVNNKLDGVWGGIFLVNGKEAPPKNRHKSDDTWRTIRNRLA